MNIVIVPFKNFKLAKSRLRNSFSDEITVGLVECMLKDVLTEVKQSTLPDKKFLLTMDDKAIELANEIGISVIKEKIQISESVSVDQASKDLAANGATSILRLPGDIPLIKNQDIDNIIESFIKTGHSILVPSASGKGTNAILRNPPEVIPSFFGANSLEKHIAALEKKSIKYSILRNENIELDIDCAEDLKSLKSSAQSANFTRKFLTDNC